MQGLFRGEAALDAGRGGGAVVISRGRRSELLRHSDRQARSVASLLHASCIDTTSLRCQGTSRAGTGFVRGLFLGREQELVLFVFFFPFHFLRQINLKKELPTVGPPPILSFRKGVPGPTNPLPSFFFYMD
jgi:hypothetical protein